MYPTWYILICPAAKNGHHKLLGSYKSYCSVSKKSPRPCPYSEIGLLQTTFPTGLETSSSKLSGNYNCSGCWADTPLSDQLGATTSSTGPAIRLWCQLTHHQLITRTLLEKSAILDLFSEGITFSMKPELFRNGFLWLKT